MDDPTAVLEAPNAAFVPAKRPIGEEIDALFKLREKIRQMNEAVKAEQRVFDQKEKALMERLDEEQCEGSRGRLASASINEEIVPDVEDWDEYHRYIHRNKAYHLLARRALAAPYRELLAQRKGKPVPGVKSFTKRTLSLRTV